MEYAGFRNYINLTIRGDNKIIYIFVANVTQY